MSLVKMSITSYSDGTFKSKISSYDVMINPDSIKLDRSIEYNEEQAPDSSRSSQKYKSTPGETLSFDLVIDCTGVVDRERTDLVKELKSLRDIVYSYNSKIHRPNFVQVLSGTGLTFNGVLTTFNTTYNLFSPIGKPLRAKVSLSFKSYTARSVAAKAENKQSPDVTHLVDVVAGDDLPALADKTYGGDYSDYYVQIAEFNGMDKFRRMTPGTTLIFPPIVQGDS